MNVKEFLFQSTFFFPLVIKSQNKAAEIGLPYVVEESRQITSLFYYNVSFPNLFSGDPCLFHAV
jgi:hypothetical protein